MEKVQLGEMFEYLPKSKFKAGEGKEEGKYKFFTSSNVQNKFIDEFIYDGECLIFGTGGKASINYCNEKFATSTDNFVVKVKKDFCTKLIYLYFKSDMTKLENGFKGASIKHISKEYINKLIIPKYHYKEQIRIVNELDKVQKIIDIKIDQINELDKLIESQFVEMFGDFYDNKNQWEEYKFFDLITEKPMNGYFAKRDEYMDDGNVSVLGVGSIVNRMYSNILSLPKTNAIQKDIDKFKVKYGDLLFCRSSLVQEGIGKASIVPEDITENILFECHVIRLILDLKKCVPEYIQQFTTTEFFRNQILSGAKTSTMTTIGQGDIIKCKVILPPYDLQKKFKEFVKLIDKQKLEIQKGLEETKKLQKSLMNKYFK